MKKINVLPFNRVAFYKHEFTNDNNIKARRQCCKHFKAVICKKLEHFYIEKNLKSIYKTGELFTDKGFIMVITLRPGQQPSCQALSPKEFFMQEYDEKCVHV